MSHKKWTKAEVDAWRKELNDIAERWRAEHPNELFTQSGVQCRLCYRYVDFDYLDFHESTHTEWYEFRKTGPTLAESANALHDDHDHTPKPCKCTEDYDINPCHRTYSCEEFSSGLCFMCFMGEVKGRDHDHRTA